MSNKVSTKIFESSPIRQIANVETVGTDALEGANDLEEASTGWVGETEDRTETNTPTVGEWRIPVFEQYAMPKTTQKLLDDASRDVGAWLSNKVSGKMARTENTAFVVGDGDKKPRGFMTPTFVSTADATRAWGEVQFIGTGVSADFPAAPAGWNIFIDTIAAVKAPYRQNAKWVMNRSVLAASMKEQDSNGQYFWTSDLTSNGFGFRILNFPVVEAEDMADLAANSLSIAFGNFEEAYTIVDRAGIVVLRDPFTAKPHVLFYTTKRVGGDVVNFEAYKAIKFI
jgi:HK97 family phage major capsid protein